MEALEIQRRVKDNIATVFYCLEHETEVKAYLILQRTKERDKSKTYDSRYSLVVTHPTTNLPICSLNMGERTGSLVLYSLWSYVTA